MTPQIEPAGGESGAGRAAGCAAGGDAPAPAGLPCRNSNNSISPEKKYRLRNRVLAPGKLVPCGPSMVEPDPRGMFFDERRCYPNITQAFRFDGAVVVKVDQYGRVWSGDGDEIVCSGSLVGPERKAAFKLRTDLETFVRHYGRNHCAFFTVTDPDGVHPREFAKRWNSYRTNRGGWVVDYIKVVEPQRNGRPHYHFVVAVEWDMEPGRFDWQAFKDAQKAFREHDYTLYRQLTKRYRASAAAKTVEQWGINRRVLKGYGLGRAELLPVRKGEAALAEYVGKYLDKGFVIKRHSWKGVRRVELGRGSNAWSKCTRVFSWNSPGARVWRARVGELAGIIHAANLAVLRRKLGDRWAYDLRNVILTDSEERWRNFLGSVAASLTYQSKEHSTGRLKTRHRKARDAVKLARVSMRRGKRGCCVVMPTAEPVEWQTELV